nr:AbrB/MazE/SpoVT family DNA-binding domain-containing protein [bacterium]
MWISPRIKRLTLVYTSYILSVEEVLSMYATIQKWGNSQGLRIPKALLDAVGLKEHDRVELVQMDDGINIRRASATPHRTLEERLTAFYGKHIDQIGRIEAEELDWGKAEGSEAW